MMTKNRWNVDRNAWIAWTVLFLIVAAIMISGSHRTVVPNYRVGALDWFTSRPLYDGAGVGGFVYFPQAAILFMPFAALPPLVSEVIWRLVNIGVLALGLRSFARLAGEQSGEKLFPLMTLVAIPLAWDWRAQRAGHACHDRLDAPDGRRCGRRTLVARDLVVVARPSRSNH